MTFNIGALYNGATYTIAIPAGGVTDEWGNSLTAPFTSTFTTASNPATGAGSVQSTNPGNTSGVPTNNLLTLYMNRQVNASTVSNSSITVTVNGVVYPGTVAVTGGGYEIQYTPTTAFPNSATVQWWFAGNVQDVYGDLFNGTSGYFYTVAAAPESRHCPTDGCHSQPALLRMTGCADQRRRSIFNSACPSTQPRQPPATCTSIKRSIVYRWKDDHDAA